MPLLRRLRSLLRRQALDMDLDEELKFHVEQKVLDLIAEGMHPVQARTTALRSFGGVDQARQECPDMRGTRR